MNQPGRECSKYTLRGRGGPVRLKMCELTACSSLLVMGLWKSGNEIPSACPRIYYGSHIRPALHPPNPPPPTSPDLDDRRSFLQRGNQNGLDHTKNSTPQEQGRVEKQEIKSQVKE
jgi:hypothetical protein